jgi:ABC-type amino acid transport substrate-binding protein
VYDVLYGSVDASGLSSGASVDLWRRVAEHLHLTDRFIAVAQMEHVIAVSNDEFDTAIGPITITPDRLARVEFTYPAYRSGGAVAFCGRWTIRVLCVNLRLHLRSEILALRSW